MITSEEIRVRTLLYNRTKQDNLITDDVLKYSFAGLYPETLGHFNLDKTQLIHTKPTMANVPGGWEYEGEIELEETKPIINLIKVNNSVIYTLDNFLSATDCDTLIELMESSGQEAKVSVQGKTEDDGSYGIGSKRATCWSEDISKEIWDKLQIFTYNRVFNEKTATDWWPDGKHQFWSPCGVSPLLRFMKYEKNSTHFTHYDQGYLYPDGIHRTLMSFVIYLTTNDAGGETQFIDDGQSKVPIWDRNHDDWTRPTEESEVLYSVKPVQGRILLFDHSIPHNVQKYIGDNNRIIIRGDIIFKR